MADEVDKIADQAFDVFKDALKGFVEDQEVDTFAKERIKKYAQGILLRAQGIVGR